MDKAVQKTDDDAATSKYSAILKGYFSDDLIKYFCLRKPAPRLPLINIGTYCRIYGVNKLVTDFLERTSSCSERAIVSLGAGSDTRPFHLLPKHPNLNYYELDFPVKTEKKKQIISSHEELSKPIDDAQERYHLIGCDLRELSKNPDLSDPSSPLSPLQHLRGQHTLLLSECCLCYLKPEDSDGVLKFFAELVPHPNLSVAVYEPISLNDEFGRVMSENLAMRGLSLPTINLYSTLESQKQRLASLLGVEVAGSADIDDVYSQWLPREELQRISRLELLDELEEMLLLMRHYCIAWGFNN